MSKPHRKMCNFHSHRHPEKPGISHLKWQPFHFGAENHSFLQSAVISLGLIITAAVTTFTLTDTNFVNRPACLEFLYQPVLLQAQQCQAGVTTCFYCCVR